MNKIFSKKLVADLRESISYAVSDLKKTGDIPRLVSVVCSDEPAVLSYVNSKKKMANELLIPFDVIDLSHFSNETCLIEKVVDLANDSNIGGILIELPLRHGFNELNILNEIPVNKDVDALSATALGLIVQNSENHICSATPMSCYEIASSLTDIEGKNIVVVGRGRTVGKPLINYLINQGATVTICHSKTSDIKRFTLSADIVFTAIGRPKFFDKTYFNNGCIIVDAGVSFIDGKISGDVDIDSLESLDVSVTPVPGGVGPLTSILIFSNFLRLISLSRK